MHNTVRHRACSSPHAQQLPETSLPKAPVHLIFHQESETLACAVARSRTIPRENSAQDDACRPEELAESGILRQRRLGRRNASTRKTSSVTQRSRKLTQSVHSSSLVKGYLLISAGVGPRWGKRALTATRSKRGDGVYLEATTRHRAGADGAPQASQAQQQQRQGGLEQCCW